MNQMYPSSSFNNYHCMSNLISSISLSSPHLTDYFETNPRHYIVLFVFQYVSLKEKHFKKITNLPSSHTQNKRTIIFQYGVFQSVFTFPQLSYKCFFLCSVFLINWWLDLEAWPDSSIFTITTK